MATATAGSAAGLAASGFHGCDGNAVSAHGSGAQEAQSGSSLGLATAHADVPRVTASTALEMVGLGRFHWQLLLVAGSGWAADGMWEEMAPLLLPQVEKEWPGVSSTVLGVLVAAQFAGMGESPLACVVVLRTCFAGRLMHRCVGAVCSDWICGLGRAVRPCRPPLAVSLYLARVGRVGHTGCPVAFLVDAHVVSLRQRRWYRRQHSVRWRDVHRVRTRRQAWQHDRVVKSHVHVRLTTSHGSGMGAAA